MVSSNPLTTDQSNLQSSFGNNSIDSTSDEGHSPTSPYWTSRSSSSSSSTDTSCPGASPVYPNDEVKPPSKTATAKKTLSFFEDTIKPWKDFVPETITQATTKLAMATKLDRDNLPTIPLSQATFKAKTKVVRPNFPKTTMHSDYIFLDFVQI